MPSVTFAGCGGRVRWRDDRAVRRRSSPLALAATLTLAGLAVFVPAPGAGAVAQPRAAVQPLAAPSTAPPTSDFSGVGTLDDGRPVTECISANPRPDCDTASHADGRTLVLLGILLVALTGIGTVIVRSTRRNSRARAAAAGMQQPS